MNLDEYRAAATPVAQGGWLLNWDDHRLIGPFDTKDEALAYGGRLADEGDPSETQSWNACPLEPPRPIVVPVADTNRP